MGRHSTLQGGTDQELYKLVETDNFQGDYPDEKELVQIDSKGKVIPYLLPQDKAKELKDFLNRNSRADDARYWVTMAANYKLQGAFEP